MAFFVAICLDSGDSLQWKYTKPFFPLIFFFPTDTWKHFDSIKEPVKSRSVTHTISSPTLLFFWMSIWTLSKKAMYQWKCHQKALNLKIISILMCFPAVILVLNSSETSQHYQSLSKNHHTLRRDCVNCNVNRHEIFRLRRTEIKREKTWWQWNVFPILLYTTTLATCPDSAWLIEHCEIAQHKKVRQGSVSRHSVILVCRWLARKW